jgi:hypothetical protein
MMEFLISFCSILYDQQVYFAIAIELTAFPRRALRKTLFNQIPKSVTTIHFASQAIKADSLELGACSSN